MKWGAALALALMGVAAAETVAPTPLCELEVRDARSGQLIERFALDPHQPQAAIAFEHSVLGTTVVDRYRFTPRAVLVEESFEGQGYGLPASAGPGEQLLREGSRMRLLLSRPVHPLVVRASVSQQTRLLLPQGQYLLAQWGVSSLALEAKGCEGGPDRF